MVAVHELSVTVVLGVSTYEFVVDFHFDVYPDFDVILGTDKLFEHSTVIDVDPNVNVL